MSRNRLYAVFFGGIFLALAVIFTLVFRDQVESLIVTPIIHWMWHVKTIFRSLNPEIVWGLFVFFLFLLVLGFFPTSRRLTKKIIPSPVHTPESRLQFWLDELTRLQKIQSIPKISLIALKRFTLEVIAYREHFFSRQEAEHWVRDNPHKYPPEIISLITIDAGYSVPPRRFFLVVFIDSLFNRHSRERQDPGRLDTEKIEEIIHFLENQIEVVNVYENQ